MTERANNKIYGYSIKEWHELADKYFEAETSEDEENLLKNFLTCDYCPNGEFDDVKAVMGFLLTGRQIHKKENNAQKSNGVIIKRKAYKKACKWVAAAMIICALGSTAWKINDNNKNVCIAYIGGNKCTNSEEVMNQMRLSIKNVHSAEADNSVDNQMRDIIGTLNDNE